MLCTIYKVKQCKLDGVGPIDNRPSPDRLHHFVKYQLLDKEILALGLKNKQQFNSKNPDKSRITQ